MLAQSFNQDLACIYGIKEAIVISAILELSFYPIEKEHSNGDCFNFSGKRYYKMKNIFCSWQSNKSIEI